ncbi:MAG: iron uptake system protein EfeO [Hyphomicrobium sp.]|uniref:iron uptake system protein EfeO n=1 Tax=Hyphomicrobium sp. TaxID=82 RepID=UPI0039E4F5D1
MSAPDPGKGRPQAPSSRLLYLGVAGAAVLVALAGAAFYVATLTTRHEKAGGAIAVAVTPKACEPNTITTSAGEQNFEIANKSERPVEWEILDGVMVVAERENIAPGFKQTLKVRLSPGTYEVTCGLLSNPRGTLVVTASQNASTEPARATMRNFLGPLSEYKFYLGRQSTAAVRSATELADAIKSGDLAKAQAAYAAARQPYKRIEPVVYRFSDLQNTIDPVATYFEHRENDPAFIGYHRIERGLFDAKNLDGLAPIADRLVADLTTLDERVKAMKMTPDVLIDSVGNFTTQLARDRLPAGENGSTQTDISDVEANVEGIGKVIGLLRPVVQPVNPELAQKIDAAFNAVKDQIAKQRKAIQTAPQASSDAKSAQRPGRRIYKSRRGARSIAAGNRDEFQWHMMIAISEVSMAR